MTTYNKLTSSNHTVREKHTFDRSDGDADHYASLDPSLGRFPSLLQEDAEILPSNSEIIVSKA